MHFSLFEYNFVYLSLAYRTKTYRKYQNIHKYLLLFHLRAIFSEPGSSSQHGKPFLLKGNFITISIYKHLRKCYWNSVTFRILSKISIKTSRTQMKFCSQIHEWNFFEYTLILRDCFRNGSSNNSFIFVLNVNFCLCN